jgi:alanine racemase
MSGAAEILVDLDAYSRNLAVLRTRVEPARIMAVVKGDGYGHGLLPIAQRAVRDGIALIGALDVPTALRLRAAGVPDEVTVFAWLLAPDEDFRAAIEAGVDLGLSSLRELDRIEAAAASAPASIHLKIDTGLHRNGASPEEWPALVRRALELERRGTVRLAGIWTHLSEASDEVDSLSIDRFVRADDEAGRLGARPHLRHLAASAASFFRQDARFDLVRIGAFGYGISPGSGVTAAELGLTPVMTVTAPVFAVAEGIARVAIGFADGLSSAIVDRVSVAIGGVRHPVIGIGVDSLDVRVENASAAVGEMAVGDTAVLFGDGSSGEQTLQEWADATGTIGEEIVTRLSDGIPRRYLGL